MFATASSPISARGAVVTAALGLAVAATLMFTRLGFYPFWGDEADTVIFARGVWETGDTSAWYGDQLYAYRGGKLLTDFRNRGLPPAGYYFAAPFWGLSHGNRFVMRLPFAVCGLATLALILRWAYERRASGTTFVLLTAATALNVSFLLYARQCRYYGLVMLLTAAVGYLYDRYEGRRSRLWLLSAALCALCATHYIAFAGVAAALVVDYAIRGRTRPRLSLVDWAILIGPTAVAAAVLAFEFNPLGRHDVANTPTKGYWTDKLTLLKQSLRDLNRCEYGAATIMALAPLAAVLRRDSGLFRLFVACATFFLVTVFLNPQPVFERGDADVRYFAPLVAPCIALTVLTIAGLTDRKWFLAGPVAALVILSNVVHQPWNDEAWQSTIYEYVSELAHPRRTADEVVPQWLAANVAKGSTIGVMPNEWLAPLIIAAPQFRYGWQFDSDKKAGDYADLPDVQFIGRTPVDYVVVFGLNNTLLQFQRELQPRLAQIGWNYELLQQLDVYYDDRTRPELIWHWFFDRPYDKSIQGIYVFRLVK